MSHRNRSPNLSWIGDFKQEPDKPFMERFHDRGDLVEGVSGCIDMGSTRFENTDTRGDIVKPRSKDSDPAQNTQDTGLDSQADYRY